MNNEDVLRLLIKMAIKHAKTITDEKEALEVRLLYPRWKIGISYTVGQFVNHNEVLYKVLIAHTSQTDWTPDISPSLFAKVLIDPTGETIPEWVQPDSTNAYMIGDKVKYEGKVYESIINNNIWSPAAYPAGWKLIEE